MSDAILLTFGSRNGSLFALVLFGSAFAALGWAMGRSLRRPLHAALAGLSLFLIPVVLIYASSLGGFYEVRADDGEVSLSFLLWPSTTRIPVEDVREIRAVPAFKLRWRLEIHTIDGRRFESATWHRVEVQESAEILRRRVAAPD